MKTLEELREALTGDDERDWDRTRTLKGTLETWLDGSTAAELNVQGLPACAGFDSRFVSEMELPNGLTVEVLATYDHDCAGTHFLAQVWNHHAPADEQRWRCVLIRDTYADEASVGPYVVHEWTGWRWERGRYPFTCAGAFVQMWLER